MFSKFEAKSNKFAHYEARNDEVGAKVAYEANFNQLRAENELFEQRAILEDFRPKIGCRCYLRNF